MRVESKIYNGKGANFTCVSGNNSGKLIACGNSIVIQDFYLSTYF